jgi:predicted lipoprotein with Yx(FWY)xxD motif
MPRPFRLSSLLIMPLMLVVAIAGVQAGTHVSAAPALVKTAPSHVLVNAKGMTLYVFAKDTKGKSNCTGQCATFWPPLLVPSGVTPPAKMTGVAGTFGVIMLPNGGDQLTYDGAPLYTFANDKKPGDIKGQGVLGLWWAVVAPGVM